MVEVLVQLLPLMIAVALSSVPIMVAVTILLAPRSGPSALLYLIGLLVGMLAVTGVFTFYLTTIPRAASPRNQATVGLVEIGIGLLLMAYALVLMVRGRRSPAETELPRAIRSVGSMRPLAALGLGLLLNIRPKALLLYAAAALILGTSRLDTPERGIVLLVFIAVGGCTVTVPVVLALARPEATRKPLQATNAWLIRNSRTVTVIVALLVGVFVLLNGAARL
jgi:hypothetical protein